MEILYLFLLVVGSFSSQLSAKSLENVIHFEMKESRSEILDFIQRINAKQTSRTSMLGFTYQACPGHSHGTFNIKSLDFEPNPLVFPGPLIVKFYVENDMDITSHLAANVTLMRKTSVGNITLPCIDKIGSCNYDDLCAIINPTTCPQPFVAAKIPCKCPFPKGIYDLRKGTTFDVDSGVFPPGEYFARINLNLVGKEKTFVGCYEISVSFG